MIVIPLIRATLIASSVSIPFLRRVVPYMIHHRMGRQRTWSTHTRRLLPTGNRVKRADGTTMLQAQCLGGMRGWRI